MGNVASQRLFSYLIVKAGCPFMSGGKWNHTYRSYCPPRLLRMQSDHIAAVLKWLDVIEPSTASWPSALPDIQRL